MGTTGDTDDKRDLADQMVAYWTAERPDLDVSSLGVLARVNLASRLFQRLMERAYARFGLNGAAFDVLALLRQVGEPYRRTPTQLYSALHVSSGTMTNRIDQLERAGLVRRLADPNDRRGLLVELTPAGLAMVDTLVTGHATLGAELVRELPQEERDCLVRGLRHLIQALEQVEGQSRDDAGLAWRAGMPPPGGERSGRG